MRGRVQWSSLQSFSAVFSQSHPSQSRHSPPSFVAYGCLLSSPYLKKLSHPAYPGAREPPQQPSPRRKGLIFIPNTSNPEHPSGWRFCVLALMGGDQDRIKQRIVPGAMVKAGAFCSARAPRGFTLGKRSLVLMAGPSGADGQDNTYSSQGVATCRHVHMRSSTLVCHAAVATVHCMGRGVQHQT